MTSLPIVIIGAGVSGLNLAQGLLKHNIPFQLYEQDFVITARNQGYRFRVSDHGIQALEDSLSSEHFQRVKSTCGISSALDNMPSYFLDAETGAAKQRPTAFSSANAVLVGMQRPPLSVDRSVLRAVLLEGLEDRILCNKSFKSFDELEDKLVVHFSDGSHVEASMLVGSDGTWSRVRSQMLPHYQLLDTEGRLIYGKTQLNQKLLDTFPADALNGVTTIHGQGRVLLLEPMKFDKNIPGLPIDYVYWALFTRVEDAGPGIVIGHGGKTREAALEWTKTWTPSLRSLIELSEADQVGLFRVVSSTPQIPKWQSSRVTLIGDAAHAMSPTSALGATTALRDSGLLVKLLAEHGVENPALSIQAYESSMRAYAPGVIESTAVAGCLMFGMRPFYELPKIDIRA